MTFQVSGYNLNVDGFLLCETSIMDVIWQDKQKKPLFQIIEALVPGEGCVKLLKGHAVCDTELLICISTLT